MNALRCFGSSLLVLALAPAALHAQGAVLVVKPTGAPFSTIQDAITAAADGDTIYVHAGTYSIDLTGRSLTIAAAEGEVVSTSLAGGAKVLDLQPDDVVVLRGLRLRGLNIANCAGTVWVEDCRIDVATPPLTVESSSKVVFVRCDIAGPAEFTDGTGFLHINSVGARLTASVVAMFDCDVEGGAGEDFHVAPLGPVGPSMGRDGIELHVGELRLAGGSVQGGKGGNGPTDSTHTCFGAGGGHGVRMLHGSPSLVVHDVVIAGGVGGTAPPGCIGGQPQPGAPGEPILVQSGVVTTVPGTARQLALGGPAIEQHVVNLDVAGVPGDAVLLLVGPAPGLVPKPAQVGPLLVPQPLLVMSLGVLGDPALLSLHVVVPELGPGVATVHVVVQGAFKPAGGPAELGSGSVLIALDSSY